MTLAAEDITYIKAHIGEWLAEESLGKPTKVYELLLGLHPYFFIFYIKYGNPA